MGDARITETRYYDEYREQEVCTIGKGARGTNS